MKIEEVVAERPTDERPTDAAKCPDCGGGHLRENGREMTLLGWSGGGWDPNHVWCHLTCNDCHGSFVREMQSGNVWYTRERSEGRVLRGMPSCFETYTYTCMKCSGPVVRKYTALDGSPTRGFLLTTKDGPQYRTEYRCKVCGHGGQVDSDYWRPPVPLPSESK